MVAVGDGCFLARMSWLLWWLEVKWSTASDVVYLSVRTDSVMTQVAICERSLFEFDSGHAVPPVKQ